MDFPFIVYPVAVVSVGLVCACLYVYDLRSQVKKQANIIREQNSKLNPPRRLFKIRTIPIGQKGAFLPWPR